MGPQSTNMSSPVSGATFAFTFQQLPFDFALSNPIPELFYSLCRIPEAKLTYLKQQGFWHEVGNLTSKSLNSKTHVPRHCETILNQVRLNALLKIGSSEAGTIQRCYC